jgi:hypothetical protein
LEKRFIPATLNVNQIRINSARTFMMFGADINRVLRSFLNPWETLITLNILVTLIILRNVTFNPRA